LGQKDCHLSFISPSGDCFNAFGHIINTNKIYSFPNELGNGA